MNVLQDIEPKKVFQFFEEISRYPRGSGNEKGISDYIAAFAELRGLRYRQDTMSNIIVWKNGSKEMENVPAVIIQGHLDMVCEKNKGTEHDFEKDGIKLVVEGDFVKANGTTLGADNGIAIAMALALLDASDIAHPPLEVVMTTYEEVGMNGAEALSVEGLKGKRFINIDSEEEGVFMVSCAGGVKTTSVLPVAYSDTTDEIGVLISLSGLKGGHSGMDIIKERGNSNILLTRIMEQIFLESNEEAMIESFDGGSKDNAIPREAEGIMLVKPAFLPRTLEIVEEMQRVFAEELRVSDPNVIVKADVLENKFGRGFSVDSTGCFLTFIMLLPNGVQSMSLDIEGLVESSNNVGVVKTDQGLVTVTCAVRSAVASKKEFITKKILMAAQIVGATCITRGDYPAWQFDPNSELRKVFLSCYHEMYGEEAKIDAIHAGLECGLFAEKIKGLDMISFGPNMFDVHTPDERISISSVQRSWKFLLHVLASL